MKKLLLMSLLACCISACVTVDYIGKQYTPTTQVEMYFDEADIKKDFEVMGTMQAEAGEFINMETIQEKMMKKAREKGADAILIGDIEKKLSGTDTQTRDDQRGGVYSSTTTQEEKFVKAKLLKYK